MLFYRRQETKQSDENGNVPKEQSYIMSEEEKQKEELLLQYKGGKYELLPIFLVGLLLFIFLVW